MRWGRPSSALVALLLLAGLALAVWVRAFYLDPPVRDAFFNSDAFRQFAPQADFIRDELRSGRIPLWNPHQMAGQPFLSLHVPAVLYPPNLLLMGLLPPSRALEAHSLVHMLISGFFTWLFAARLGLGWGPRLVAAVGFMLAGTMLRGVYMIPFFSTLAWFPAMLWALHGLLSEARVRWALLLAIFQALAFLGGHAQGLVYEVQVTALYGVFGLAFLTPSGARLRVLALTALTGVVAFCLVAPQLLPALELATRAVRGFDGVSYEEASRQLLKPLGLVLWLLGNTGGGPKTHWFLVLPWIGLPLLALGALVRSLRAQWLFFALLAAFAGAFVLGRFSPVFGLYYELPLGRLFRLGPPRFAFVFMFSTALLTALGLQATGNLLARMRAPRLVQRGVVAALALVIVFRFAAEVRLDLRHPLQEGDAPRAPAALLQFLEKRPTERIFIESGRSLYRRGLIYKAATMYGFFAAPDYEPSMPRDYELYFDPEMDEPWHGRVSILPGLRSRSEPDLKRLLDLMSIRYYVALHPITQTALDQMQEFVGGRYLRLDTMHLIERPSALPRAYAVRRVSTVPDAESALERILDADFAPALEAVVVEERGEGLDLAQGPEGDRGDLDGAAGSDTAEIVSYAPHEVAIDAHCGAPCLLVLTDLHYPGWRVRVDGDTREVLKTNAIFRGVALAPGAHRVVYRYAPTSLRVGLVLLALGIGVGAGALVLERRRPRTLAGDDAPGLVLPADDEN